MFGSFVLKEMEWGEGMEGDFTPLFGSTMIINGAK